MAAPGISLVYETARYFATATEKSLLEKAPAQHPIRLFSEA